ncbi:flavodoxin domain-containing protein [Marivibrio halodurans]|uniref:Flavodoxin domain-containing protein n=1 Tax=Marivibrio halodurans TaxID=2039722 RepID=A0A8J7V304_9PROT|nr:flavodoxin domain-containing protein [Marivibrio halodurans]MBP5856309.1 flavodoxin domain-containing protein [Marivibrio halodurans]
MSDKVTILVGTMTGTAELVADEIAEVLNDKGLEAEIELMDDLDSAALSGGGTFIICTSTYGSGDVPDNGHAFIESLDKDAPDLSAVRYGVFALGDMTYAQTFCFGGKQFDEMLSKLGARRIGEVMKHNASEGTLPEDVAADWAAEWYDTLMEAA